MDLSIKMQVTYRCKYLQHNIMIMLQHNIMIMLQHNIMISIGLANSGTYVAPCY